MQTLHLKITEKKVEDSFMNTIVWIVELESLIGLQRTSQIFRNQSNYCNL